MCLVAFQKKFRKIFSDVWKRRRKRQTQEKYHQQSRSTLREITPSIAISDRDQRRGRRTGFVVELDLGCGLCFSGFVFSFFFSKHQKIFSGKFFKMQPNT